MQSPRASAISATMVSAAGSWLASPLAVGRAAQPVTSTAPDTSSNNGFMRRVAPLLLANCRSTVSTLRQRPDIVCLVTGDDDLSKCRPSRPLAEIAKRFPRSRPRRPAFDQSRPLRRRPREGRPLRYGAMEFWKRTRESPLRALGSIAGSLCSEAIEESVPRRGAQKMTQLAPRSLITRAQNGSSL